MKQLLYISIIFNLLGLIACSIIVYKLGGITKVMYKIRGKHMLSKIDHRQSQFINSPVSLGAVIFLGDSITEYGEWSELFPDHKILNRGISGDGIKGVYSRLDEINRHDPQAILLMIGVNDLCYHSPETVIDQYNELLNKLLSRYKVDQIRVQSILPVNNDIYKTGTDNIAIDKVNYALSLQCDRLGLVYIDLNTPFKDKNNNLKQSFSSDGIHINGIAYNKWKQVITPWLSEL